MPHKLVTKLRHGWRKRYGVMPMRESLLGLSTWFGSPLGLRLTELESASVEAHLRNIFGYHLMQLSVAPQADLTHASRISHKFALYPQVSHAELVSAVADFNHLPLPPNSLDLVILHHVLDYSQSPHHVLRESANTLISHGYLVVIGFNPWSLFGLWRWLARWFSTAPQWRHQSLRLGRVLDWLAVLDLEPVAVEQGFFGFPCQDANRTKYLQWMERWGKRLSLPFGGFYVIVARKDSLALTPLKPLWQGYAGLRGWGVIKILGRATRGAGQPQCRNRSQDAREGTTKN